MQQEAVLPTAAGRETARLLSPTLLLCIAGLLLPNALSIGAMISGIGLPPRTTAIILYAMVALSVRYLAAVPVAVLFVVVAIYDGISTIALQFGLAPSEIGLALHLANELDLFKSPLYAALIVGVISFAGLCIFMLTRFRAALRNGSTGISLAAVLLFVGADFTGNTSAHYQFGALYGANAPMQSAAVSSGFRDTVLTGKPKRVLVVIVEALGKFADPLKQEALLKPFRNPELQKRYRVTNGSTTYFGSTTAGEMRELCDTRASYSKVASLTGEHCLPQLMRERGYKTEALHHFTKSFFDRAEWYPKIGFQEYAFREDLKPKKRRKCGGPFRAPCDVEMLPRITRAFQEAKEPLFYYWLTLSTHVPVMLSDATPRLDCANRGGAFGHKEVCGMAELWMDVFDGIIDMTAQIGPTEILLVGDHSPPLWSRAGRALFEPGKVTWVRLSPRGAE